MAIHLRIYHAETFNLIIPWNEEQKPRQEINFCFRLVNFPTLANLLLQHSRASYYST